MEAKMEDEWEVYLTAGDCDNSYEVQLYDTEPDDVSYADASPVDEPRVNGRVYDLPENTIGALLVGDEAGIHDPSAGDPVFGIDEEVDDEDDITVSYVSMDYSMGIEQTL